MRTLWLILLIDMIAVTGYAVFQSDAASIRAIFTDMSPWELQIIIDLTVALTIGVVWMWRDAKKRGVQPLPFLILTLLTGSIGLLIYLIRHRDGKSLTKTTTSEAGV